VLGLERFQRLEPLELGYLAAVVPRGHDVRVLDLRLERFADFTFSRALRGFRPDLVGLSGYTHEASEVKRLARTVRRVLPGAFVVVGGHHATVAPKDYDLPEIDAIVRGEGCGPFAALVRALAAGGEVDGIPNLLGTGNGFDATAAAVWPRFPDPATTPTPRRDLYDLRRYYSVWTREGMRDGERLYPPVAMARTSFGCRMKCSFCIVPYLCGGEHRPRPVAAVADEIAAIPVSHVYFCDDENFIDEAFAADLADALEARGVAKRYFAWCRATTVNRSPELMRRWHEVGLDAVFVGFEFPTDEELRGVHKGGTVAANERALDTLRGIGIAVHAAFMVMPEYGHAEFDRLSDYVRAMPPVQCSFTVCTPSPGTPDYEAMRPRIWVDNPDDLHDCMHPLTPTALPLREFARRYADQVLEGIRRGPLRTERRLPRPDDLARALWAEQRYGRAFRSLYRDYPRELWD
jgi:radical SAM superfamily enzyme YgiQ (UPF0313 family)